MDIEIRPATLADLTALVDLEVAAFASDRISRRQFRYLLGGAANAVTLVAVQDDVLRGYVLLLFNRGHSMARLYSIAVADDARGQGCARHLVTAAEAAAREQECAWLRLEIRADNTASIALFRALGYVQFGAYDDYYEDHADALRFEKSLATDLAPSPVRVPFYAQTTEFTCGPAALMMAMRALDDTLELERKLELRLWREATTIFMTSGHGGCGPHGLALAAARRGFGVALYLNESGIFLGDSVRSAAKREVMQLVQEDMQDELAARGVPLRQGVLSIAQIQARFEAGAIPLALISSYQLYGEKWPHWVVVTGFDRHFVYVHDPYIDTDAGETAVDSINVPIPKRQFERMARYGRSGVKATLLLARATPTAGDMPRVPVDPLHENHRCPNT